MITTRAHAESLRDYAHQHGSVTRTQIVHAPSGIWLMVWTAVAFTDEDDCLAVNGLDPLRNLLGY